MSNALNIANLVIIVGLGVVTNGFGVVGIDVQPKERIIPIVVVWRVEIESGLADVLSAVSRDEPVYCIVDIVCVRFYIFVIILNRLYCVISDMRNVSNRVVGVVKVLHDRRVGK